MTKHRADILRECCSCRIAVGLGGTPVQERFDAQITYAQHGEQFQTLEMAELVGSGDGGVAMQGLRERADEGVSPIKEILLQGVATIVLPLVRDTQAAFCLPVHVLLLHVVIQTAIEGGEDSHRLLLRTPITLLSRLASFIRVVDIGEKRQTGIGSESKCKEPSHETLFRPHAQFGIGNPSNAVLAF